MSQPLISIITVNYKQPHVTCELLDSIARLSYPNLEVIVVDNGQPYDDTILYKHHLHETKVINSLENVGFAGANNLGIKKAKGDYIFLLNNDTEITDGVIEALLPCFKDSNVGAVSPVLRYFEAPEKIQYAGFTEINPITGRNKTINSLTKDSVLDTPYFHGAAVMISKEAITKSGLMPESYFLYYEELDWSRALRSQGYELKVCTAVSVLHKESVTTGKNSPLKTYYQTRNRLSFMNKHSKPLHKLLFNLFFHLVSLPVNLLRYAAKGQKKHLSAFYRGFYDASLVKRTGMSF